MKNKKQPSAVYGIIGYPVTHSLSPLMHNAVFKELGLDATYKIFPIKEEELQGFFTALREQDCDIFGLNVTVPYKEMVIEYLDVLSPFAIQVGAVNTIVISRDRKFVGYNTDGPGFLTHLEELEFDTSNKRVVMLGAGGSARSIIATLCLIPERPVSIKIYNRNKGRAEALITYLNKKMDASIVKSVDNLDDLNIELADLLINATPLGLKEDDPCIIPEAQLHENLLVYDLVYNPPETKLLKLARKRGGRISNGLGMLFYQGILSFQHWSDIELDQNLKDVMRAALQER